MVAQARIRPAHPALVCDGETMTYGELGDRTRRVALALQARGVEPGDRVAVMLTNSPDWFAAVHGIGRLGAVAVPVNTHFKADETGWVVGDSGSKVVIAEADLASALSHVPEVPALLRGDGLEAALADVVATGGEDLAGGPAHDGWPTTMLYTSGTTGRPKGVAIGEDDFRRTAAGFAGMGERWAIGPDDRHLLVGPAYHAGPAAWAQMHLAVGGTVVVMPRWDAEWCLALIEDHRIGTTHMVPANFIRILDLPPDVQRSYDLSSLRLVVHAAAPCPIPVKREFMALVGADKVWEYYGASEGGGTSISPEEWSAHPGSVGRPYPGNEFRILDDEGHERPAGEAGTIWVRSDHSSFRYHNDDEKTAASHRDGGWFSVGDIGYFDEDGYLYITDRKSDMVISGGVNIYPREIENALYDHDDVADCAVLGVPDDKWGESLLAVVQPRAGVTLTAEAVEAWCREQLADYKRPRRVEFVDELPRDPNGKVIKRRLREQYG